MNLQTSKNNDITTIEGNGFALYVSANGQVLVKDTNGKVANLADLLGALGGDQNNIARPLRLSPEEEVFTSTNGTLTEKIVALVNSLQLEKSETDCQYIINLDMNPSETSGTIVTGFAVSESSELDPCTNPEITPYSKVLYHDGSEVYPQVGDQVFTDYTRKEAFVTPTGEVRQNADTTYLRTDASGFVVEINCL